MVDSIHYTIITTPLGDMHAYASSEGVVILQSVWRSKGDDLIAKMLAKINGELCEGTNVHLEQLKKELKEYFEHDRRVFTVPILLSGTDFQCKAWEVLRSIPYGETIAYSKQAELMCMPRAVRAVGQANGKNPIEIVVPCHRVIGLNGGLTGFSSGVERKEWILCHESKYK